MESGSPKREEYQNALGGNAGSCKKNRYWKAARIVAFFGIIEMFSLVLWSKSEDFSKPSAFVIRWIADCGFLAGAAFLAHKLTDGEYKKVFKKLIWALWLIICGVMFLAKTNWDQPQSKPFPNPYNSSGLFLIIPAANKENVLETNSIIQLDNGGIIFTVENTGMPTAHITIDFIVPLNTNSIDMGPMWRFNGKMLVNHPDRVGQEWWYDWILIDNAVLLHAMAKLYSQPIIVAESMSKHKFPAQIVLSSDNTLPQTFNVTFLVP